MICCITPCDYVNLSRNHEWQIRLRVCDYASALDIFSVQVVNDLGAPERAESSLSVTVGNE
jgi:hypothetical protein